MTTPIRNQGSRMRIIDIQKTTKRDLRERYENNNIDSKELDYLMMIAPNARTITTINCYPEDKLKNNAQQQLQPAPPTPPQLTSSDPLRHVSSYRRQDHYPSTSHHAAAAAGSSAPAPLASPNPVWNAPLDHCQDNRSPSPEGSDSLTLTTSQPNKQQHQFDDKSSRNNPNQSSFESDRYDLLVYLGETETETEDLVDTERSFDYQDHGLRQTSICDGASLAPTLDGSFSELLTSPIQPIDSSQALELDDLLEGGGGEPATPTNFGLHSDPSSPGPRFFGASASLRSVSPAASGSNLASDQQQVYLTASDRSLAALDEQKSESDKNQPTNRNQQAMIYAKHHQQQSARQQQRKQARDASKSPSPLVGETSPRTTRPLESAMFSASDAAELDRLLAEMSQSLDLDSLSRFDTGGNRQPKGGHHIVKKQLGHHPATNRPVRSDDNKPNEVPMGVEKHVAREKSSTLGSGPIGQPASSMHQTTSQQLVSKTSNNENNSIRNQQQSNESILDEYDDASRMLEQMLSDQFELGPPKPATGKAGAGKSATINNYQQQQQKATEQVKDKSNSLDLKQNQAPTGVQLAPIQHQQQRKRPYEPKLIESTLVKTPEIVYHKRNGSIVVDSVISEDAQWAEQPKVDQVLVNAKRVSIASDSQSDNARMSRRPPGSTPTDSRGSWAGARPQDTDSLDDPRSMDTPPKLPQKDYPTDWLVEDSQNVIEAQANYATSSSDEDNDGKSLPKKSRAQLAWVKRRTMSSMRSMRSKLSDFMAHSGDAWAHHRQQQHQQHEDRDTSKHTKLSGDNTTKPKQLAHHLDQSQGHDEPVQTSRASRSRSRARKSLEPISEQLSSIGQQIKKRLSRSKSRLGEIFSSSSRARSTPNEKSFSPSSNTAPGSVSPANRVNDKIPAEATRRSSSIDSSLSGLEKTTSDPIPIMQRVSSAASLKRLSSFTSSKQSAANQNNNKISSNRSDIIGAGDDCDKQQKPLSSSPGSNQSESSARRRRRRRNRRGGAASRRHDKQDGVDLKSNSMTTTDDDKDYFLQKTRSNRSCSSDSKLSNQTTDSRELIDHHKSGKSRRSRPSGRARSSLSLNNNRVNKGSTHNDPESQGKDDVAKSKSQSLRCLRQNQATPTKTRRLPEESNTFRPASVARMLSNSPLDPPQQHDLVVGRRVAKSPKTISVPTKPPPRPSSPPCSPISSPPRPPPRRQRAKSMHADGEEQADDGIAQVEAGALKPSKSRLSMLASQLKQISPFKSAPPKSTPARESRRRCRDDAAASGPVHDDDESLCHWSPVIKNATISNTTPTAPIKTWSHKDNDSKTLDARYMNLKHKDLPQAKDLNTLDGDKLETNSSTWDSSISQESDDEAEEIEEKLAPKTPVVETSKVVEPIKPDSPKDRSIEQKIHNGVNLTQKAPDCNNNLVENKGVAPGIVKRPRESPPQIPPHSNTSRIALMRDKTNEPRLLEKPSPSIQPNLESNKSPTNSLIKKHEADRKNDINLDQIKLQEPGKFQFHQDLPDPEKLSMTKILNNQTRQSPNNLRFTPTSTKLEPEKVVVDKPNVDDRVASITADLPKLVPDGTSEPEIERDDVKTQPEIAPKMLDDPETRENDQNRLSVYENASHDESNAGKTIIVPSDVESNKWRPKPPVKPKGLGDLVQDARLMRSDETSNSADDSKDDDTQISPEIQVPLQKAKHKLVARTSIIQEPNDQLMIAATSSRTDLSGDTRTVNNDKADGQVVVHQSGSGSSFDDFQYDDDTDESMAVQINLNSRQKLIKQLEKHQPVNDQSNSNSQPKKQQNKPAQSMPVRRIIAHQEPLPQPEPSDDSSQAKQNNTSRGGSFVKRLAMDFDRFAQENSSPKPTTTTTRINNQITRQQSQSKDQSPVGGRSCIQQQASFSQDEEPKSESTWYDARGGDTDLDEAEVAEFLRNFDRANSGGKASPRSSSKTPTPSTVSATPGRLLQTCSSISISTGADPYVTVAEDNTADNTNDELDDNDDTLNDGLSVSDDVMVVMSDEAHDANTSGR